MPHVAGIEVRRAWRHRNEVGRIHYIVTSHEGVERHLYERDDSALGRLLALRGQAGTAGPDARDRTSVAAAVTAGEEDAQPVVREAAKAPA